MIRSSFTLCLFVLLLVLVNSCARQPVAPPPAKPGPNEGRLGSAARDILTDSLYTSVLVEIQYMEGFEPDPKAVRNLVRFIEKHSHKPDGVRVLQQSIPTQRDTLYSLDEVIALEKQHRKFYNEGKQLALYVLYTNGVFVQTEMLGYAYRSTSAVIFGKNVLENSNTVRRPSRSNLESKVTQHEIAHLMGLVNVGTPLQSEHKDNDHGKHCLNKKCLMYYLTDTEESPNILYNRKPIPVLDDACLADLRANGGR